MFVQASITKIYCDYQFKIALPYPAFFSTVIIVFILFMVSPFLEYMLNERRVYFLFFCFVFFELFLFIPVTSGP